MSTTFFTTRQITYLINRINEIIVEEKLDRGKIIKDRKGIFDFNTFCNQVFSRHGRTYSEFSKAADVIVNFYINAVLGSIAGERLDVDTMVELPMEVPDYKKRLAAYRSGTALPAGIEGADGTAEEATELVAETEAATGDVGTAELIEYARQISEKLQDTTGADKRFRTEVSYSLDTMNFHRYLANELRSVRFDINSAERDIVDTKYTNTNFKFKVGTGGTTLTGRSAGYIYTPIKLLEVKKMKVISGLVPNMQYHEPRIFLFLQELPVESYASTSLNRNAMVLDFEDQYNITASAPVLTIIRDREFVAAQNDFILSTLTFVVQDYTGDQITTPADNFVISVIAATNPVLFTLDVAALGLLDHGIQTGDYIRLMQVDNINNPFLNHLFRATRVNQTQIEIPSDNSSGLVVYPEHVLIEKYQFRFSILFLIPYQKGDVTN